MFNSKAKTQVTAPIASYEEESEKIVTLLGEGSICEGNFSARDTTRIDGCVNGNTRIEGSLIIGPTGKVNGNVVAQNVFLAGEINGNIDCKNGKLDISDTGKLIGDVITKSIVIDENALFQGNCTMTSNLSPAATAKERAQAIKDTDTTDDSSNDSKTSEDTKDEDKSISSDDKNIGKANSDEKK